MLPSYCGIGGMGGTGSQKGSAAIGASGLSSASMHAASTAPSSTIGSDSYAKQMGSNAAAAVDSLLMYNSNTSDDEMSQVTGNTVDYNTNDYKYMYDDYSENDYIATGDIISKKINYNNSNYMNSNFSNLDTSNSLLLNNQMAMAMDGMAAASTAPTATMTTAASSTAATVGMGAWTATATSALPQPPSTTATTTTASSALLNSHKSSSFYCDNDPYGDGTGGGQQMQLENGCIGMGIVDPNYGCYVNGTIPLNDPLLSSTHLYTTPHEAAVNNIVLKQQQEIDPNEVYEEDYEDDVQNVRKLSTNGAHQFHPSEHATEMVSTATKSVPTVPDPYRTQPSATDIYRDLPASTDLFRPSATAIAAAYQMPYYNYQHDYFNEEDEYKYLEKEREEAHHDDGRPLDEVENDGSAGGADTIEDEECESGGYSAEYIESDQYILNHSGENGTAPVKGPDDVLDTTARNQQNKKRHLLPQESISDNDFFLQHFDGPGLKGLNKQESIIEELDETLTTSNSKTMVTAPTSDSLKSPIARVPSTRATGATTLTVTSTTVSTTSATVVSATATITGE